MTDDDMPCQFLFKLLFTDIVIIMGTEELYVYDYEFAVRYIYYDDGDVWGYCFCLVSNHHVLRCFAIVHTAMRCVHYAFNQIYKLYTIVLRTHICWLIVSLHAEGKELHMLRETYIVYVLCIIESHYTSSCYYSLFLVKQQLTIHQLLSHVPLPHSVLHPYALLCPDCGK